MNPSCTSFNCTKIKLEILKCNKCQLSFCQWHLLFTETKDPQNYACICCYFNLPRTQEYADAPISDTLAKGLLTADETLRNRIIAYQLAYHRAQERYFDQNDFFHPMLAGCPRPDADIKEFCLKHR